MRDRPSQDDWIEDPTDADYARASAEALTRGLHARALELAVAAYCIEPSTVHLRMIDRVIDATPRPLVTLRPASETTTFYGTLAGYARALARHGRVAEAFDALLEAVIASPATPVVAWAHDWSLRKTDAAKIDPERVAARLVEFEAAARRAGGSPDLVANVERLIEVGARLARHRPDPRLTAARSRLLRLLERNDEAEALVQAEPEPTWVVAVERAAIAGARDDLEARSAWLLRASELRPDEEGTWIDLGDAHLSLGDLEGARRAFERARSLSPESALACGSVAYVDALLAGRPLRCPELLEAAFRSPSADATTLCLRSYAMDLKAYETDLADPVDPILGVLRSFAERAPTERSTVVRARIDGPLAPSARRAFDLIRTARGLDARLEVVTETHEPLRHPLFDESGRPSVPPPSDAVAQTIGELASSPFDWGAWTAAAGKSSAAPVGVYVAAMAHPAPAPPSFDVPRWVHAWQIASALLAAASDGQGAVDPLESIASILEDWSAIAAMLGLALVAETDPSVARRLDELARDLASKKGGLRPSSRGLVRIGKIADPVMARIRGRVVAEGRARAST